MPELKNLRHERFAQNIAMGMNATAAYAAAGYKPSTAHASRLAVNGRVVERVRELTAPALARTEATVERVLEELTSLAYYDVTQIFDSNDGRITMKDPRTLPEDLRRSIIGIKPVHVGEELLYECKFTDKLRALECLARYIRMFKGTVVVENVFQVIQKMSDKELDRRLAELEIACKAA
jgi:phage terminase small subunit